MNLAGLPAPAPVADSPSTRRDLMFLLGRVAQAMDVSVEAERQCWRDLGAHAHGLLDDACCQADDGRAPKWWMNRVEKSIAGLGAFPLRKRGLSSVAQRVVDILTFTRPKRDQLAEIVLIAYNRSGDLK